MTLLIIYVVAALAISFLCSILEAALLSVRVVELEERKNRGDQGAVALLHLKQEKVDDAISAILILNTVAHTAGAALAGNQAGKVFGDEAVGIFSAILILLVLVVTEIIPKTLGTVYASSLVGPVSRTLQILIWLLKPALVVTRLMTRLFARKEKKPITRGELAAMVAIAARQGTLEAADLRLVKNVLRYDEIRLEDVMTPRTVLEALPADATLADFLAAKKARAYSRIPIYDETRDDAHRYVLQRDVLAAAAEGADPQTSLADYAREALSLPADQSVAKALRRLTESHRHMALVRDQFGGLSGLVTLEDLIETILGIEIVDESDRVPDLRAEAAELRDQRLAARRRADSEGEETGQAPG